MTTMTASTTDRLPAPAQSAASAAVGTAWAGALGQTDARIASLFFPVVDHDAKGTMRGRIEGNAVIEGRLAHVRYTAFGYYAADRSVLTIDVRNALGGEATSGVPNLPVLIFGIVKAMERRAVEEGTVRFVKVPVPLDAGLGTIIQLTRNGYRAYRDNGERVFIKQVR